MRSVAGHAPSMAAPQARGARVEYRRAGLTEWYLNDDRGLEQGFTLDEASRSDGDELRLQPRARGSPAASARVG